MDLSPEIIDAMRSQHDAMGFEFNREALTQVRGLDMISQRDGIAPGRDRQPVDRENYGSSHRA